MSIENETKKKHTGWIVFAVICGFIVLILNFTVGASWRDKQRKKNLVETARTYFENEIPNVLRAAYKDFPVEGDLVIEAVSEWEHPPGSRGYEWNDTLKVTLETDESFDDLTDREKYTYLKELGWTGIDIYQRKMEEVCPGYFQTWRLTAGVYDRVVYPYRNQGFYITTPRNTYKAIMEGTDRYAMGKSGSRIIYLNDPQSKYYVDPDKPTPTPTPAAKPTVTYAPKRKVSKTSKPEDPYEAHLFDDPDDYADYYAEEFAEEIGEDVDEGYTEAYDHWIYWHEMND